MEIRGDSSVMFTCTALCLQWHEEDRWSAGRLPGQDRRDPWASASGGVDRKSCDLRQILLPFSSSFFSSLN